MAGFQQNGSGKRILSRERTSGHDIFFFQKVTDTALASYIRRNSWMTVPAELGLDSIGT
jgi:hypothetical protein